MTLIELAHKLRPIIEKAVDMALDDTEAIEAALLFPKWTALVKEGRSVNKGFRFQHEGLLYKTVQPSYTFVDTYTPGTVGTESLFARVDETHAGTVTDPIPYSGNMELVEGLYYSQNEIIYLCTRSTGQAVYHALADLIGLYVEVA